MVARVVATQIKTETSKGSKPAKLEGKSTKAMSETLIAKASNDFTPFLPPSTMKAKRKTISRVPIAGARW
ncbi:MAG: hypothetical protein BWY75_03066 [bacterium ADurb.Bin425]|nr:MAG: hypothetical protein BWY75_03066 [bacterium ADurb.Bin425]